MWPLSPDVCLSVNLCVCLLTCVYVCSLGATFLLGGIGVFGKKHNFLTQCYYIHMKRVSVSRMRYFYFYLSKTNFKYWYFYPHQSRNSVSPVCSFYFYFFLLLFCDASGLFILRLELTPRSPVPPSNFLLKSCYL